MNMINTFMLQVPHCISHRGMKIVRLNSLDLRRIIFGSFWNHDLTDW